MSAVIASLLTLAPQAYAAPHGDMRLPFDGNNADPAKIDTNSDGKISATEMTAARTTEYATINTDSSNDITFAEFHTYVTKQQTAKLTSLDSNNSGTLSLEEVVAGITDTNAISVTTEVFDLADSDNNNELSAAEFNVLLPNVGGAIQHFAMLDQNHDLVISQEEYLGTAQKPTLGRGGL